MLILASGSPRRKELLKKLTSDFTVVLPNIDERILDDSLEPQDLPAEESRLKAYAIHAMYPDDEVIACDTIVILDEKILGKPLTEDKAIAMLKEESGHRQIVLSGYTYIGKRKEITRSVPTAVYFNILNDEEIVSYVAKFHPLDKAGGYGIQDEAGLINHIEGSYDNVMGFPTEDVAWHVFAKR
jgi:septum formation protein